MTPRTRSALVAFHTRHKLELLARSPVQYAALGRLVAAAGPRASEWWPVYAAGFREALAVPATRARHVNVLQHLAGHFRRRLPAADRHALGRLIEDYARGLVPLRLPRELIVRQARRCQLDYVLAQTYLDPRSWGGGA
jgi:uncharacterized protein YbgA (DUF1722 family)